MPNVGGSLADAQSLAQPRAQTESMMTLASQLERETAILEPIPRYADHLAASFEGRTFPSKGDRTRYRLKVAAVRCLEESGFQDLKVSDICLSAGLALGTFYVYFDDKSEIAGEVLLEFVEYLYENAHQQARGHGEFESILITNRFFLAAYQANAGLVRCFLQFGDQFPAFRERWNTRRLKWVETLARSISKRSAKADTVRPVFMEMAFALEGMVWHYLYDVFVRRDSFFQHDAEKAGEVAELLSVLWYRAVYCENPPTEQIVHVRDILDLHPTSTARSGKPRLARR
jgi:AcrR family transcriptional regulator